VGYYETVGIPSLVLSAIFEANVLIDTKPYSVSIVERPKPIGGVGSRVFLVSYKKRIIG
jgi:hypothetical protein